MTQRDARLRQVDKLTPQALPDRMTLVQADRLFPQMDH